MSTMSGFIEDGAREISAFASIPLNDAFRRLPTNPHTFIGLSMVIILGDRVLVRSYVRAYAVAGDLWLVVKSGFRFSRKAVNASLASSERTCLLNSSFSACIAALICPRNGCFMSLLLACSAAA